MKTLREVTEIVGLTRRMIQEYEKAGLAKTPTAMNKYGHLLYNEEEIRRLWQLKFYKELGYSKAQIRQVFNAPDYNRHDAIEAQIALLEQEKARLEKMIDMAKSMNATGVDPVSICCERAEWEESSFDVMMPAVGRALKIMKSAGIGADEYLRNISVKDRKCWMNALEQIVKLRKEGETSESEEVQEQVDLIYRVFAKTFSRSILLFSWTNTGMAEGNADAVAVDALWGKGSARMVYDAIGYYCSVKEANAVDQKWNEAFETLFELYHRKSKASSADAQRAVQRLYEFFEGITFLADEKRLQLLGAVGELFGTTAYKELIDGGDKRGVAWFASHAIKIYVKNRSEEG